MTTHAVVEESWPPPDTVNSAVVVRANSKLILCYGTGEEAFAVVTFPACSAVKVGGPNDEALNGHPLYRHGLKHYSVHRIYGSPWLEQLEQQNSVHPSHSKSRFLEDKVHYLFALKEETVECIVRETATTRAQVEVFGSYAEALKRIKERIDA